jgi:hypothetical protein
MKSLSRERFIAASAITIGSLGLVLILLPVTTSSATYSESLSPTGSPGKDTVGGSAVPAPQCQWQINGSTNTPSMVSATKYAGTALTLTAPSVSASAKVTAVGSDPNATCVWWSSTGQSSSVSVSMTSNLYLKDDHSLGIYNTSGSGHNSTTDYGMYDSSGYLSWVFKSTNNDLDVVPTVNSGDNSAGCSFSSLGLSSTNAGGATLATISNHGSQQGCSWTTVYSTAIPDQTTLFNGTTSSSHNGTGKSLDATFGAMSSVTLSGPLVTTTLSLS